MSALDVSVRAQILILLRSMQERLELTYLFIGHDLAVVRYVSTIVGVMYFGRMVEIGPADELLHQPLHPYTQQLVAVASMSQPLGHQLRANYPIRSIHRLAVSSACAVHTRRRNALLRYRLWEPPAAASCRLSLFRGDPKRHQGQDRPDASWDR